MRRGNVYLAGFMGTGKSVVGRALARRLKMTFVDIDAEIARWSGKSIAEIFDRHGEPEFRRLESRLVRQVSRGRGQVVALGGGALLKRANRARLRRTGTIVRLTCSGRRLWQRLKREIPERPLLNGTAPRARLRGLIRARKNAYEAALFNVSTTNRTPVEAARAIAERLEDHE